jgi:hypothetical protein
MTETPNLGLPLVQPAQAQKHVTVTEAFVRLDAVSRLTLASRGVALPPPAVVDGVCYAVPAGAVNAWSGRDGQIAVGSNGGWDFITPRAGWSAFVLDEGQTALFDGTAWRGGQVTMTARGAGLGLRVIEFDHSVTPGPQSLTPLVIPPNAVVFGVTGRVVTALSGSLSGWDLGNPGAAGRYGTGLGVGAGSFVRGVLGQPTAFYAATALQLDATGGSFAGGTVRLAVHLLELSIPGP